MLLFLLIIFKIWLSFGSIRNLKRHKLLRVCLDCERQKHYPPYVKIFTVFLRRVLYSKSSTLSCSSPYCLLVNGISRTFIYILASGNMKFYISWYSRADGQIRIWRQLCLYWRSAKLANWTMQLCRYSNAVCGWNERYRTNNSWQEIRVADPEVFQRLLPWLFQLMVVSRIVCV